MKPGMTADLSALRDALGPESLADVIDAFLMDAPERLRQMRLAADRDQPRLLAREAHTLKGASSNFQDAALVSACFALETAARAERRPEFAALIALVEGELARVSAWLQAQKATL
jgi:histidine phosphotransfer protein HptB